jgi:hypothetical protein
MMLGTPKRSTHLLANEPAIPFGSLFTKQDYRGRDFFRHRTAQLIEVIPDQIAAQLIELIEASDSSTCHFGIRGSFDDRESGGWMIHSAGGVDARGNPKGYMPEELIDVPDVTSDQHIEQRAVVGNGFSCRSRPEKSLAG